jgi:3-dehydroquinate synthase
MDCDRALPSESNLGFRIPGCRLRTATRWLREDTQGGEFLHSSWAWHMTVIRRTIECRFEHSIGFTTGVFDPANTLLKDTLLRDPPQKPARVLVVLDEGLHRAQPALALRIESCLKSLDRRLDLVRPPVLVEGGESLKNSWNHVSGILAQIDRYGIDRHSYLIAVGGGALLDVAGLAAATAHRGVRHIRIPSTTLSQCDSGVGVKNGINAFGKKNFVGTFAVPFAVINDFELLESLSDRDKRGGYSEAVKVACIKDAEFFEALEADAEALSGFKMDAMKRLVYRSAELHVNHIATAGDPFELGSARPLDFGHWSAHKLEQLSGFRIRHGEAVAIGVALDTLYSRLAGFLAPGDAERVLALLEALGFDLYASELSQADSGQKLKVLQGLEEFRTHLGGELTVTLLRGIGQGFPAHEMDGAIVAEAMRELQSRHAHRMSKPINLGAGSHQTNRRVGSV